MDARNRYYKGEYMVDGTAARQLQVVPDYERQHEQETRTRVVEQPKKAPKLSHGIDFISMILLSVALVITLYLCYNYLQVQGNIVQLERDVMVMEQELDIMLAKNDALEDGLNGQVDWEQVYLTAVGELGMVYPNNNEVITYESRETGHVIQYKDIPE
ncbi:MAG: hypothetical protein IJZ55_09385 [Lachnospiraceae bacterium]|nr:hypothetical protein [Lachnospiraceae bacterium]